MRKQLLAIAIIALIISLTFNYFLNVAYFATAIIVVLIFIGFYNANQNKHAILRNFPVLGYFRYAFETISPEIQQYFIERNTDGKPFSRNQRGDCRPKSASLYPKFREAVATKRPKPFRFRQTKRRLICFRRCALCPDFPASASAKFRGVPNIREANR